jgi:hypothetical protein
MNVISFLVFQVVIYLQISPNVVVEWLTGIREVSDSNFDPETGYPNRVSVFFLSPSRQMSVFTLNYATTASSHILSN